MTPMIVSGTVSAAPVGDVDALKFRSCMTLFKYVPLSDYCFRDALMAFYAGEEDAVTLEFIGAIR